MRGVFDLGSISVLEVSKFLSAAKLLMHKVNVAKKILELRNSQMAA